MVRHACAQQHTQYIDTRKGFGHIDEQNEIHRTNSRIIAPITEHVLLEPMVDRRITCCTSTTAVNVLTANSLSQQ
jgi:hypothetical protein